MSLEVICGFVCFRDFFVGEHGAPTNMSRKVSQRCAQDQWRADSRYRQDKVIATQQFGRSEEVEGVCEVGR